MKQTSLSWPRKAVKRSSTGAGCEGCARTSIQILGMEPGRASCGLQAAPPQLSQLSLGVHSGVSSSPLCPHNYKDDRSAKVESRDSGCDMVSARTKVGSSGQGLCQCLASEGCRRDCSSEPTRPPAAQSQIVSLLLLTNLPATMGRIPVTASEANSTSR